ncbi:MAG: hypothetical protein H7339_12035 [Arcicella sp.]|nr:hypothetical protein [Arcicella sp.]
MKFIKNSFSDVLSIFGISIIIFVFYYFCNKFSYNFFYQDDFHLLRFVTIFNDNSVNLQEKFNALYGLHNEHRIVFPRLFALIDYYLQGHIDWQILNVVSALYYLGIFTFFALIIKKINLSLWYILPVALFIFQPSSYQNFYWTISILQQVGNLFWAMFLFYSLVYFKPEKFWIPLSLIIVLTFTHGNGLFAFGVGGLLLFLQKRFMQLGIWIGLMVIVTIFYFWGYYTAQNSNISGSLSNPVRLIGCFGGFWGGFIYDFFKNTNKTIFTILWGLVVFVLLLIVNSKLLLNYFLNNIRTKFQTYFPQENLFLLACFLYLTVTAFLVALSRSWISISAGFQNRYLHNSVIALILLYITILHYNSGQLRKTVGIIMLFIGLFFNIFSWYNNFELLTFQRKSQEADAVNYQFNKISIVNDKSFNVNIKSILEQSYHQRVSVFPNSPLITVVNNLDRFTIPQITDYQIEIKKDSIIEPNNVSLSYKDIFYFNNLSLPYKGDVYIVMKSSKNTFISPTGHRKNSKINLLKTGQFFTDGFVTTLTTNAIPKNEYQIGIIQKVHNRLIYIPTKYKILTR